MNSDVGILRSLSRSEFSGVSLLPDQETTLSLDRRFVNSIKDGITEALSSKLMKFDPSVGGVLLNRENITDRSLRVLSNCSELIPSFQVSLQCNFYVFAPRRGDFLDVAVMTVGRENATALALGTFKVHIQDVPRNSLEEGQALTIRIVSVAYKEGLPEILGVSDNLTEDFNQEENLMDIHKVELEVEGDQMELEEAEDVKPRVRKPSRKIKRKQLKLQRKKQFELPADFTTITRKSKGRVWKEYLGPDGKRYRSLVAIQRDLAQAKGNLKIEKSDVKS